MLAGEGAELFAKSLGYKHIELLTEESKKVGKNGLKTPNTNPSLT
jgi:hypothetical protein